MVQREKQTELPILTRCDAVQPVLHSASYRHFPIDNHGYFCSSPREACSMDGGSVSIDFYPLGTHATQLSSKEAKSPDEFDQLMKIQKKVFGSDPTKKQSAPSSPLFDP